ncbi:MAG TPA: MBL fold metallo-hydrolase [Thermoanaerobaculia bacterium]|jgi:phosphoribosyl 1,2-cyclic phosphate phosphodiesterase|nr:MBL fold metallo-hydrolase [Thermoanaerobaculia bacterium]
MRVTFLGSGTSTGVPVVGCSCAVCTSSDPRNKRLRQSVKIEMGGKHFLIDTSPDLRLQLLKNPIPRLDFVLFTHSHSDHLMGLDDIRPFNFRQREAIQAFANPMTAAAIRRAFNYIWSDSQIGGGKPQLDLIEIDGPFVHEGIAITPLPVTHGDWTILGFRIGGFAYITDTNGIPDATMKLLEGVEILALDGLRISPRHPTHFVIDEAVAVATQINARETWLIHLTHEVDHETVEATLPAGIRLAYDGLVLECDG